MKCSGCGREVGANDRYCTQCGTQIAGNGTKRIWVWIAVGVAGGALVAVLILRLTGLLKRPEPPENTATPGTTVYSASAPEAAETSEPTPTPERRSTPAPEPVWPPVQSPVLMETPSANQLFEKGMSYLNKNQYFNGLAYIGMAANEGSYSAQYRLYVTYSQGHGGMPLERIPAEYWNRVRNRQSAAQDDPTAGKGTLGKEEIAAEYERSEIYFRDKEYPSAIAYLGMLANEGDVSAQYLLGQCYMEGVTKERYPEFSVQYDAMYAAGIYWLEKAAEQGHCCAQGYLGYCYRTGRGVERDLAMAFARDRQSAAQDCPFGLIHIGYFYADPLDDLHFVEKNYYIARMFYEAADAANHCYATTRLGELENQVAKSTIVEARYVEELDMCISGFASTNPAGLERMEERSQGVTIEMIVNGGDE